MHRDLCIIPTNSFGLTAALRLRKRLMELHYPHTVFAAAARAVCHAGAVDCVFVERFNFVHGLVTHVLLAKVYAVAKLFAAGTLSSMYRVRKRRSAHMPAMQ